MKQALRQAILHLKGVYCGTANLVILGYESVVLWIYLEVNFSNTTDFHMNATYEQVFYCSASSVFETATKKTTSAFGGSSVFKVLNGKIIQREKNQRPIKENNTPLTSQRPQSEYIGNSSEVQAAAGGSGVSLFSLKVSQRIYSVNAKKVRSKALALFNLKQSRKFCAFITISFPNGFSDADGYRALNIWLTRVRKYCNLKYYLWVAERQKNGTIHYHVLVNQYLNVRIVNYYMAATIDNIINRNTYTNLNFDKKKYNGVDIKRVDNNIKAVSCYLSKYVSKSSATFERLAFHCSRAVSALFTSTVTDHFADLLRVYGDNGHVDRIIDTERGRLYLMSSKNLASFLKSIYYINEQVNELI